MGANKPQPKSTTVAFRTSRAVRLKLEAIQVERGHADLSDTLREAAEEYIQRHLTPSEVR